MFERYAIFQTPTGSLAAFGAAWLGWDSASGAAVLQPDVGAIDVAAVTATPRRYGFHGTLKAPFRMAQSADLVGLQQAAAAFASAHASFEIGEMELVQDSGFVALRPAREQPVLRDFAANTVMAFDPFRAPLTDAEIDRRRQARLTDRQDRQMRDWGYPYIFDDFQFHLTLSGPLLPEHASAVIALLRSDLIPIVPNPFIIDAITLMGQDSDGLFHQIDRYALTG